MTEEQNQKTMEQCPRFQRCNAPQCSLDYWQEDRVEEAEDDKCGVSKSIRVRIGKDTELPRGGLKKSEYNAKMRWEAKPEAEKQEIRKRMRARGEKMKREKKGIFATAEK